MITTHKKVVIDKTKLMLTTVEKKNSNRQKRTHLDKKKNASRQKKTALKKENNYKGKTVYKFYTKKKIVM